MSAGQLLSTLRWQLLLAVCLLGLAAAALYAADVTRSNAEHQLRRAENAQRQASSRLLTAREQEDDVRAAIDEYAGLVETRLIGPEQRLNWVERLDAARERLKINTMRYEILPQHRLDNSPQRSLNWMESRMRLSMEVPHGQALLALIDALVATPSAVVQPWSCDLRRGASEREPLYARCELRWLTVQAQPQVSQK